MMTLRPTKKSWILAGVITTVIVHAALLFSVIPQFSNRLTPFYNQDRFIDSYDQLAQNLIQRNGYRFYPETANTLMREPGYPIFLATLYLTFGSAFTVVKLANMVLALATAAMVSELGRRISPSNPVLLIAPALLFLFHPATLIAESRGGVEILFTCLITLFMLVLYDAIDNSRVRSYAAAGGVLGVAVLVRSTPILFPLFLFAYLFLSGRHRAPKIRICRNIAAMVAAAVVVLSPWIVRNYLLTGRFVPTATVLGVSAHAGQYICRHFSENKPWYLLDKEAAGERSKLALEHGYRFKDEGYYQMFFSAEDELNFSEYLTQRTFKEYEKSPSLFLNCVAYNLFNFWFAGKSWVSTAMNILVQSPYLVLSILGAVLCLINKCFNKIGPLVLFIVYFVGVSVPILAQARYGMPLIPFLAILSSISLPVLWETTRGIVRSSCGDHHILQDNVAGFLRYIQGRK